MADDGRTRQAEFERTAVPHLDAIYSAALYLSRDPDTAADLLQETYLRAYRAWHQFTASTNCKAWLLTILYNAFRNRYRAEKAAAAALGSEQLVFAADTMRSSVSDDPAERVQQLALEAEIEAALLSLPEEFRAVVVLVDLQDVTYEEAAAALECPVGTIRSRLFRARRLLRSLLREYAD